MVCNPNDPTGDYMADRAGAVLAGLPEHVHVLLDEALVHFQDEEDMDSCCGSSTRSRGCRVAHASRRSTGCPGCAGVRRGLGRRPARRDRARLGVNALTQAAVEHALRIGDAEIDRRRRAVSRERKRLTEELAALART